MHQRGARGRQVVGVDRAPRGRRVEAPHRVSVPDHGGQGVPDQGGRELVEVEEVRPGVVDADRAVGRVGDDVRHDHRPAAADPALGGELGRERERGRLEAVAVEGAERGRGRELGQVRPVRGLQLHPGEDPGVSGSCRQRSRTRVQAPPAARSGTRASRSRSSNSITATVMTVTAPGSGRHGDQEPAALRPSHPATSPKSSLRCSAHPKTTSARSLN